MVGLGYSRCFATKTTCTKRWQIVANGRILGAERMEEERMSWLLGEAYAVGRHKGEALLGLCLAQSAQVEPSWAQVGQRFVSTPQKTGVMSDVQEAYGKVDPNSTTLGPSLFQVGPSWAQVGSKLGASWRKLVHKFCRVGPIQI